MLAALGCSAHSPWPVVGSCLLTDFVMPVVPAVLLVQRVTVLEIFEVVEGLFAVENPDVLGLGRSQAADSPAQMHEMGLDRCVERSEEHTSELQSPCNLVCRLLLEKKRIQR